MLGKIEGGRGRGREDEMVGWHHRLKGHEFEQAPGDGKGQGSLVCCSPSGCKELDMTEQLNNNKEKSKNHRRGSLDSRNLFPHSSGGRKSEIKWWAGLVSLTGLSASRWLSFFYVFTWSSSYKDTNHTGLQPIPVTLQSEDKS